MSLWTTARNIVLALIIVPILCLWALLGWILSTPFPVAAIGTFVIVGGLSIASSMYDAWIITSGALVLLVLFRNMPIAQAVVVAAALAVDIYRRTIVLHDKPALLDVQTVLSCVLIVWTWLCLLRLWIPARVEKLIELEDELYKSQIMTNYTIDVVAGLGTVYVPYCGETTNDTLPPLTLVLVHGYGAGNGLWANNLQHLAKHFNVYAVEWHGIGRSDRPAPPKTYEDAETFFVGSIERWRQALGLNKIILCGHSMGGIFVTNYALQYPNRIEHLILASPAGVPHPPPPSKDWRARIFVNIVLGWGVTPMTLVRFAGPFGQRLVQWGLRRRISWVPSSNVLCTGEMDLELACDYIYHNWASKRSGEVALLTHLGPGATTKRPLRDLILPGQVPWPVTFIYGGDGDWMKPDEGQNVVHRLQEHGHFAAFKLIPSAGHQLFLDNPRAFNAAVIEGVAEGFQSNKFCPS
ncbi:unnamed protein product [Aphanomyces euteiches]